MRSWARWWTQVRCSLLLSLIEIMLTTSLSLLFLRSMARQVCGECVSIPSRRLVRSFTPRFHLVSNSPFSIHLRYGNLTPDSVRTFFDTLSANFPGAKSITASTRLKSKSLGNSHSDFLLSHWRGRIGLDKSTAHEVYEKFKVDGTEDPEEGGHHDASVDGGETLELRPKKRVGSASGR